MRVLSKNLNAPVFEQGTWTPVLWDSSLSSSESQAYAQQFGRYQKVGNVMHFWGRLQMTSLGTLTTTDQAHIGGLPLTSANTTNQNGGLYFAEASDTGSGILSAAISGRILPNTNYASLTETTHGVPPAYVTVADISATGDLYFTGMYVI